MPSETQALDRTGRRERERRALARHTGNSAAIIYRDTDVMRRGVVGKLLDISVGGLGIALGEPLEQNEQIKILLTNEIQRVKKEVRGVVKYCAAPVDGTYRVGISLVVRLTPLEVSYLSTSHCLG